MNKEEIDLKIMKYNIYVSVLLSRYPQLSEDFKEKGKEK